MDPVRELEERSNAVSIVSVLISLGMDPVSELEESDNYVSIVSVLISR
jgi:hypothetical protein